MPNSTDIPKAAPLSAHNLFTSVNLDEARERVTNIFCPHRLDMVGQGTLSAIHNHISGRHLSLNFLRYGAKTVISPEAQDAFYMLQIPLSGSAAIKNGDSDYHSDPSAASLLNPHWPTSMIWEEGTEQILVQVDQPALEAHLSGLIKRNLNAPLVFDGPMRMDGQTGADLRQLVFHLVHEIDAGRSQFSSPGLMARTLEDTIMSGLLEAIPHNYSQFLSGDQNAATPGHLRRAEEFVEAKLKEPITVLDIADAAGTTARGLQIAFRKYRNTTPMQHLRERRLQMVYQDLSAGVPGTTVSEVALRWGFTHFGRFSQIYKVQFGESPVQTLKSGGAARWQI